MGLIGRTVVPVMKEAPLTSERGLSSSQALGSGGR